jgi:SAM-dependent methyltransferase
LTYSQEFFSKRANKARNSARQFVPYLLDLTNPASVLDLGCANGIWLSVFAENGVADYAGIDGPWVDSADLAIPADRFHPHDMAVGMPDLDRRFDLAVSVEVAEHLPESAAGDLVDLLCQAADAVVFSAAIPGQGGTGHINEQPQSYWARLFARNGYRCFDAIRPVFWNNPSADVVQRQNMLLYVAGDRPDLMPHLDPTDPDKPNLLDVVHPEFYRFRLHKAKRDAHPKIILNRAIKRVFAPFRRKQR